MALFYYPQFDLIRINAAGLRVVLTGEDIDVTNINTSSYLTTLTSDAEGVIAAGSLSTGSYTVSDGDVIEFSHSSYPLTMRMTLRATPEEANDTNYVRAYTVENLRSTIFSDNVEVYMVDEDNITAPPIKVGTAPAGTSLIIPYPGHVAKDLRFSSIAIDETETRERPEVDLATYVSVTTAPVLPLTGFSEQPANKVFAGPPIPSDDYPTFRSLVVADLPAMTSAQFAARISDETGIGQLVFATSPVFVAPILGTPNSGVLTNCTGFPAANLSGMASWMPSFLTTPLVTDVRARSFTAAGVTNPGNTYFYSYSFENSSGIVSAANFAINNMNAANAGTYGVLGEARQAVDRSGGAGNIYGGKFTAVVAGNLETAYGLWGRLSVDPGKTATEAGAVLFGTTINGTITTFSGLKQELVNAGTVTNFYGTFTRIQNNASSTITTANALRISSLNNGNTITTFKGIAFEGYGGSGAITNNYLIYADTSPASYGSTNKYGIYFLCDMPSYHVGKFGIGSGATAPSARLQVRDTSAPQVRVEHNVSNYLDIAVSNAGVVTLAATGSGPSFSFSNPVTFFDSITMANAKDIVLNTSTGTKIGTATTQKLGFWNTTPIVQPTTGVGAATRSAGVATAILTDDTFDGYTVHQVVKALRNVGLLA